MAARKLKTKDGLVIQVWDTSIRVTGTHQTMSIGNHFTDEQVILFVEAIYNTAYDIAERRAKADLAQQAGRIASDNVLKTLGRTR